MIKTSYTEYLKFMINYFEKPQIKRFGQMFLEQFYPEDLNSPLYYISDFYKESEIIIETYVDEQSVDDFWNIPR